MSKLAIIGGGIGGCSAAYFARKYLPNIDITIYEAQSRLGGRVLTQNVSGTDFELGAAFFNGTNKTIMGLVNAEHLKFKRLEERTDFAIWNGSKLVFRSSKQPAVTNARLLAKYKFSLARAFLLLREAKTQFVKMYYDEQESPGEIGELLASAGLDKWYTKRLDEILLEAGVSQSFVEEIVAPIARTIYTQNADLGGLAGIISLVGVYSNATYSLAEGNSSLPTSLAEASNAKVKLRQRVDGIEKTLQDIYRISAGEDAVQFDAILIAAPLDFAGIKFDGLQFSSWVPQPYQRIFRRIARGVFNPGYFGLKNSATPPGIVLTTKGADPITQCSIQKANATESFVTVSSPEPLNDEALTGIFKGDSQTVWNHNWSAAYPAFKPITKLPPTKLDKNVIYLNSIEPSVSSMETAAFSALNAVRMLLSELK